jgi:5'-nucleotidase
MDGVLADWGRAYGEFLDGYGEAASAIPRHHQQTTFNLNTDRTPAEKQIIKCIMNDPSFYAVLEPIPGARTALREMLKEGHDVRIVTSPWVSNPTCASDKLNWVVRRYGAHWGQRVIITTDKTIVRGDVLIDDKPDVTGVEVPDWTQVFFTQPYNVGLDGARITNWSEWRDVLATTERITDGVLV